MKLDIYFDQDKNYSHLSYIGKDEMSIDIPFLTRYTISGDDLDKMDYYKENNSESDITNNFEFSLSNNGQILYRRKYTFDFLIEDKIKYRIKPHPYFNFITLPQISSPANRDDYFTIMRLVDDLYNPNSDLAKLCVWKADLISKMSSFYQIAARVIEIKNGVSQKILANEQMSGNIKSVIIQTESSIDKIYHYNVVDNNGLPILIDNKPARIKLTLDSLRVILTAIEVRRGYCAKASSYHFVKISLLSSIQDYNYLTDDYDQPYKPAAVILIDDNGNIIS